MQLRLSLPLATTVSVSGFKQGLSSILAGVTIAGAFSTLVFTSEKANNLFNSSLEPIKQAFVNTPLYDGIQKAVSKFKDWGGAIVGSKDAFAEWIRQYLNPDGLKTGIVQLYEKLKVWVGIVYTWFRDKFWEFIKNIPDMVKDWDKLRLSLFKWGTFLGGGGGAALWAAFSSGENFEKFSKLMEREDFGEMMAKLSELVENNDKAFNDMEAEEVQQIIQKYLDEPEEAKKATEDLLKKQAEEKEKAKKDETAEDKEPQLEEQEIKDAFSPKKGGNPPTPVAVLKNMTSEGVKALAKLPYHSFFERAGSNVARAKAKEAMIKYIEDIKIDAEKEVKGKKPSAKQKFLKIIENAKDKFIDSLTEAAVTAYERINTKPNEKILMEEFIKALEGSVTVACADQANCKSVDIAGALKKG